MRTLEESPAPELRKPWTTKELAYVREHYPSQGGEKVAATLGRSVGAVCRFASKYGIAKDHVRLDMGKVSEIRTSREPARVFAERFGVSVTQINRVRQGLAWRAA
ncbi:hypothetical protein [Ottowia sp. VDI28]|uniref:hypothetical protein n=1 Tax=Ottowia sp. VDI28 TaxID=3133968 RepID=UPI003C30C318